MCMYAAWSLLSVHLHSTLVRFYDPYSIANAFSFANLHSTLVRFYVRHICKLNRFYFDLHSTLVRFYACHCAWISLYRSIYIPHWLDSMSRTRKHNRWTCHIYIPHWLDSMLCPWLVILLMPHLHSTLVRFYVCFIYNIKSHMPIYIPHWLDSMVIDERNRLSFQRFTFHTG